MQIVIDIPNNEYERIIKDPYYENIYGKSICNIMKKGITLTEKHGRLIDEDRLMYRLKESHLDSWGLLKVEKVLKELPTVIEAVKEGENE